MPKTILIHCIRHPKVIKNSNTCYGQFDLQPCLKDVDNVYRKLKDRFDIKLPTFSSDLQRCKALAKTLSKNVIYTKKIREISFGDWEAKRWDDIPSIDIDLWAKNPLHFSPPNGESLKIFQQRILSFLQSCPYKSINLITHKGVARVLDNLARGNLNSQFDLKMATGQLIDFKIQQLYTMKINSMIKY